MKIRQFLDNYRMFRRRSKLPYVKYEKGDYKYVVFGCVFYTVISLLLFFLFVMVILSL